MNKIKIHSHSKSSPCKALLMPPSTARSLETHYPFAGIDLLQLSALMILGPTPSRNAVCHVPVQQWPQLGDLFEHPLRDFNWNVSWHTSSLVWWHVWGGPTSQGVQQDFRLAC